jgi:hypothetical protein
VALFVGGRHQDSPRIEEEDRVYWLLICCATSTATDLCLAVEGGRARRPGVIDFIRQQHTRIPCR